ncbi:MAG TPA: tRNA pseudouridine(55) synthase TruB [Limnochordia bacterium]|nr:tRNA pseudouridine(55) synthase TruB [Limnochordia bacterium]
MDGIINVLKPPGMSSHQVVTYLRRLLKIRRIGHGGTLDPGASGVLPILVGSATRLSGFLLDYDKTYVTELTLGIATSSQDASGQTTLLNTDFTLTPRELADVLATFQGPLWQTPPMASAVRVGGKRLYELERQGKTVARPRRQVHVHSINIMAIWHEGETLGFGTRVLLRISCSKGTYIRTLCHDIGEKLGVGAHMSFLSRVKSGPFHSEQAYTLEELTALVEQENFEFLLPMQQALPNWVQVKVHPLVEERIKNGNYILPEHLLDVPSTLTVGEDVVLLSLDGQLLALAEIKKTDRLICQPFRVFMK